MDQRTLVAIVIVVTLIVIAAIVVIVSRKRRSQHLRERFGTEYDRAVKQRGNRAKAELELLDREKRVHSFSIKPLLPAARDRFAEEWSSIQRRFVDDPGVTVLDADSLVNRVMTERGYPMADFEQRAADVSATYPAVVQNYRAARAIVVRYERTEASTEDLRQAMVHYRSLFDELLDAAEPAVASNGILHKRAS
jgi:type II secretory pathway pseudopilin PulG